MKKIILISIMLFPVIIYAQTWQWAKQIGGPGIDETYIGHIDNQHNVYLYGGYAIPYAATTYYNCFIGNDTLFGSKDAFLAKYDNNGTLLWVKNCVSPNGTMGIRGFVFDPINTVFYIAGTYQYSCNIDTCNLTTSNQSAFLAKLNSNGNCLWAKNVGTFSFGTSAGPLTIDNIGNIYMGGTASFSTTIDSSTINPGTFLAKFDPNGNNLWAKTKFSWTGSQPQIQFNTLKYFNNNIYATGLAYAASMSDSIKIDTVSITNHQGNGFGLVCMDANNSTAKWLKFEGQPHTNTNYPMMDLDNNGNIYCTGTFFDTCVFSHDTLTANASVNGFLSKYDSYGNIFWLKQLYSTSLIACAGICLQADGSVFTTGTFSGQGTFGSFNINASSSQDLFISRYNNNGDCLGVDHAGIGVGLSIAADESSIYMTGIFPPQGILSGSINIAGNTFTNYGWEDIVFAKHDLITGIIERNLIVNNSTLIIYANPNKGSFLLKIPEDFKFEQKLILSIYDIKGNLIRQQLLNMNDANQKLDIFGEANGIYNVILTNGKKTYSGKMIVE